MVSDSLFHSPPGVLFTFPSRYLFTIGVWIVFSLTGWSRQIQTGFHVPRPTQDTFKRLLHFKYRTFTFYGQASQLVLLYNNFVTLCRMSYNPSKLVWALPLSLATTNRIIIYFLFLMLLRCFSSHRVSL